jgi:hypothetical protein
VPFTPADGASRHRLVPERRREKVEAALGTMLNCCELAPLHDGGASVCVMDAVQRSK